MTEEIEWLRLKVREADARVNSTVWYVFGSASRPGSVPTDIDVLIVYRDERDVAAVRERTAAIDQERPLHLIFMTEAEEREFCFIKNAQCIPF